MRSLASPQTPQISEKEKQNQTRQQQLQVKLTGHSTRGGEVRWGKDLAGVTGVSQAGGGCSGRCQERRQAGRQAARTLPCSPPPPIPQTGILPKNRLCLIHSEKREVDLATSQGEAAS